MKMILKFNGQSKTSLKGKILLVSCKSGDPVVVQRVTNGRVSELDLILLSGSINRSLSASL